MEKGPVDQNIVVRVQKGTRFPFPFTLTEGKEEKTDFVRR